MTRRKMIALLIATGVAVAVGASLTVRPTAVETVHPTRGVVIESLVGNGRVAPAQRVSLAFETMGTVVSVTVAEGAEVSAGDALVQLEDGAARASVDQARALLAQAEAQLVRLRGTSARVAEADVRVADVQREAASDLERTTRDLAAAGAAAPAEVDEASRARAQAEAALDRARALALGVSRGGGDLRVAAAARDAAQAALRAAQAALDARTLRAPFDGIVLARRCEPGAVVQPGVSCLELASRGPSELVLHVDESHLARLALGQPAMASAESAPSVRFGATVARIAPAVDPQRGTVEVRLAVAADGPSLRPDTTVSVEIETGRAEDALTLPSSAVSSLATEPTVLVVEDGRLARRPITISLRGDDRVAVSSGLTLETTVVTSRGESLVPGARVRARGGR